MSWIDEKAHAELARVRKARKKQVYPYFREFAARRPAHADRRASRSSTSARTTTSASPTTPKVKEAAKRAVDKYACGLSSSRPQATTPRARRARAAPGEVDGLRELPALHDRLPGDARHARVAGRQGHDAGPRRVQPRLHPRRHVPRRGRPQERPRDPLLQPQLGQEPRAHPDDARAQERPRRGRGRLLARRRHGEPRGVRRHLRALRRGPRRRRRARQRHDGRARPRDARGDGPRGQVPIVVSTL